MNRPPRGSKFIFVDQKLCKAGGVEISLSFTNRLSFKKNTYFFVLSSASDLFIYLFLNLCLNVEILHEADAQQSPAVYKEKQMEG